MALVYWWIPIALLIGVLVGIFMFIIRRPMRKPLSSADTVIIANTKHYRELPEFKASVRRYRRGAWLAICVLLVSLAASSLLSARVVKVSVDTPELRNRDIMLCLDVSGSMRVPNGRVIRAYQEVVKGFKGERIGLVVFNSNAVTLFPLTDDYDFIQEQLRLGALAFPTDDTAAEDPQHEKALSAYTQGTTLSYGEGAGSDGYGSTSLIGDGLASCVQRFDSTDQKRSRSVILATDNELGGTPIMTFMQAATLAKQSNVRVYGLNPAVAFSGDDDPNSLPAKESSEYRAGVLLTGGAYYKIDAALDTEAKADRDKYQAELSDIIEQVTSQEAARMKGSPRITLNDQIPAFVIVLTAAAVMYGVVVWRLRL